MLKSALLCTAPVPKHLELGQMSKQLWIEKFKTVSKEAGKAAELAEERKLAHYDELSAQYIITPVANETLGSWGSRSLKFIQELGQRICEATGEKRSTSYLFQSLSIATQRGNIASIRGSLPDIKTLHEIYYL